MRSVPPSLGRLVHVDRAKLDFSAGLRCALGVAAVLVGGELAGHPEQGVTAAVGAISCGFASLYGTYRGRAWTVAAAAAGMALAAFAGATVGHVLGPDLAITAALGFAAGIAVALGQAGTTVGIQTVVGFVVFSQFRFSPGLAATEAGFVLAGGAVQMLVVVVLWPLRRFPAERRALSDAYMKLAEYARSLVGQGHPGALLDPGAFVELEGVVQDPQPFASKRVAAAVRALADQAERVRLELSALGRARARVKAVAGGGGGGPEVAGRLDELLELAARFLGEVPGALRTGTAPQGWEEARSTFESTLAALRRAYRPGQLSAFDDASVAAAYQGCEALAGQLRAVLRLAAVPAGGEPVVVDETALAGTPPERGRGKRAQARAGARRELAALKDRVGTLRANLDLSSEAFRHALRVSVALVVGIALSHLFQQAHRYWLPLTIIIVLRPDYGSTFSRGAARVVGTLFGAGLVTLAVAELRPGQAVLSAMVVALYVAAVAFLFANYAIFSAFVASLVVTLLASTGQTAVALAGDRSLYTALGAAVALAAYALWPTWAASSVPDRLAELLVSEARYGTAVLHAWAAPAAADRAALQRFRAGARLARTNAEAAVERWLSEPARRAHVGRDVALGVLAATQEYVQAVLSLHARLPGGGPGYPAVEELADEVGAALSAASGALTGEGSGELPPLRLAQLELRRQLGLDGAGPDGAGPDGSGPGRPPGTGRPDSLAALLAMETDQVVNATNTIGHLTGLRRP